MTGTLLAPIIPSSGAAAARPARALAAARTLALTVPAARPPALPGDVVYGLARVDRSGRVADRSVTGALGRRGGDRLTLTAEAGVVVIRRDPSGLVTLPPRPCVPVVSALVTDGCRRAYGSYWNRVTEQWGSRGIDEPTPGEIQQLVKYVRANVVPRRNSRGGRSAAEHLIGALRCLYKHAEDNGLKLLILIGSRQLIDRPPDGEDWYANLPCLSGRMPSITHAASLFTVFEADVRAADLRDPGRLVTGLISRELQREQLPADTFGSPDPAAVSLAKTADRSVLGCMNDMAFMCETVITRSGGLAITDMRTSTRRCDATSTAPGATSCRSN